jgi:phosphoenolpyruvate carboxykinase (ATP)
MLGKLLEEHKSNVWLVNTGWSGGPYGVGKRMKLSYTRAMVHAALSGSLDNAELRTDPVFGLGVPVKIAGVPGEVLDPRGTWTDPAAYDAQAKKLAEMFRSNFTKFGDTAEEIRNAGPTG